MRANPARDTWNVLTRELKPVVRDPFTLIFSLVQPLVFLGLFAPLLIGSSGQPVGETLQWFVPGVLVMIVLFGTGATGSNLQYEMMTGSHERTLVAPLARSSLLVGRALKEIAPIVVQSLIIVLIAWPFGFTINVPGLVIGLALLAVFGVGLGSLSYTLALKTKDREWLFWGVQQTLIFPLLILSGMLLPLDDGTGVDAGGLDGQPRQLGRAGRAGAVRRRPRRDHRAVGVDRGARSRRGRTVGRGAGDPQEQLSVRDRPDRGARAARTRSPSATRRRVGTGRPEPLA